MMRTFFLENVLTADLKTRFHMIEPWTAGFNIAEIFTDWISRHCGNKWVWRVAGVVGQSLSCSKCSIMTKEDGTEGKSTNHLSIPMCAVPCMLSNFRSWPRESRGWRASPFLLSLHHVHPQLHCTSRDHTHVKTIDGQQQSIPALFPDDGRRSRPTFVILIAKQCQGSLHTSSLITPLNHAPNPEKKNAWVLICTAVKNWSVWSNGFQWKSRRCPSHDYRHVITHRPHPPADVRQCMIAAKAILFPMQKASQQLEKTEEDLAFIGLAYDSACAREPKIHTL